VVALTAAAQTFPLDTENINGELVFLLVVLSKQNSSIQKHCAATFSLFV